MEADGGSLVLEIPDDGVGFDPEQNAIAEASSDTGEVLSAPSPLRRFD